MTEQKTLREKIAQLEFCQQNCGLLKKDCRQKNCTEVRREIFQDELTNPNSWPCGMADSILSLMLKEVECTRLTDSEIYRLYAPKGKSEMPMVMHRKYCEVAAAQLEAVKKRMM
jgi:hypothetical protein